MSEASSTSEKWARQARWRAANPQKYWAHQCLRSAVKRGLVVQQNCEVCGNPDSEAHHHDYSRPMTVRWFCRRHHREEHHKLKEADLG